MVIPDNKLGEIVAWMIVSGGFVYVARFLADSWKVFAKATKGAKRGKNS